MPPKAEDTTHTPTSAKRKADDDPPAEPRKRGRPPKPKPPVDENEPQTPKRPRGRPPKPKPPIDENNPPSPKRPRGRPPKPKPEGSDSTPPPKRPRGRPPKPKPEPSSPSLPTEPPRGRGRPPKPKPVNTSSSPHATPTEPPRGRGRPPKPKPVDSSPALPPRPRGRPPKVKPVEGSSSPQTGPSQPSRGRGRPPKVKPVEESSSPKATTSALPKAAPAPPKWVTTESPKAPPSETPNATTSAAPKPAKATASATPKPTTTTPKTAPRSARLSESLAAAKSSTPRKNESPSTLPSFDQEVFGTPSISRETFRANEALRRQREARNFTFDGDANAPRTTRSGRVVAREVEADEYGGNGATETEDGTETAAEPEMEDEDVVMEEEEENPVVPPVPSLPPKAQPRMLTVLETLTGQERQPAPLPDEESNEALQGVVSLLRGTVERGEGNSALVTGPRGAGKTRTVERALCLLPSSPAPIIVRLSGHAQTDDRKAIREMGRQIAAAEGKSIDDDDDEEEQPDDFAPTTLPSHLLALLTAPSPRAIIVIIDEFDLFTEHARQALLYCLLDVVQSVQTGPVETTARGIAVIGLTSRVDTLLLLEKRVKSRFSHRVWRVASPLAPEGAGWKVVLRRALVPWTTPEAAGESDKTTRDWMEDWTFAVDTLLENKQLAASLSRLAGLTTDIRLLFRPFIPAIAAIIAHKLDFISVPVISAEIKSQLELAGWGTGVSGVSKLRGLPHPALGVLIVAKHLAYAGRAEFSFAQVEDEYLRFARTRLIGSGRTRWPPEVLRKGFDLCRTLGLLAPAGPATAVPRFAKFRATITPHEVVAFFRGEGSNLLGPELGGWGKLSGGHA